MVLQLPKLLDDGCVLQAGATIHIWGAGDPGRGVLVRLDGKDRTTRVGDDGSWSVPYGPIKAGGPYDLTVRYEDGTECISRQCYAGEVFLCSGQSNMVNSAEASPAFRRASAFGSPDSLPLCRRFTLLLAFPLSRDPHYA